MPEQNAAQQLLDGKVAIVTGAGNGIGRAEAHELAAAGARVVVNDLGCDIHGDGTDEQPARRVADEICAGGGTAIAHSGDVADWHDMELLIGAAIEQFGRLDILVNNAGIVAPFRIIADADIEGVDRMFAIHVRGTFATSILATRHWREEARRQGGPVDACIVNTSSEAFLMGSPWRVEYAAAKAAIVSLTIGTSISCAPFGVRTNAICPHAHGRMSSSPVVEPSENVTELPEDVAHLVVALASPQAKNINGQVFTVNSGGIRILARPTIAAEFESLSQKPPAEVATQLEEHFSTPRPSYGEPLSDSQLARLRTASFG